VVFIEKHSLENFSREQFIEKMIEEIRAFSSTGGSKNTL
jgi:hypothetical protein